MCPRPVAAEVQHQAPRPRLDGRAVCARSAAVGASMGPWDGPVRLPSTSPGPIGSFSMTTARPRPQRRRSPLSATSPATRCSSKVSPPPSGSARRPDRSQRGALLTALAADFTGVVQQLSDAVGSRLSSAEFCDFLAALDLSQTGALDRATLARAVRVGAHQLTPGRGPDSARRLFDLVREQAMPGRHRGITAEDVLAELAAPELVDLYPAPPRLLMYPTRCPRQAPAISRRP